MPAEPLATEDATTSAQADVIRAATAPLSDAVARQSSTAQEAPRDITVRLAELAILMTAIVGAVALGLGISAYLGAHRFVTAYLVAYGVFRLADLMVRSNEALRLDRERFTSRIMYELPLLLLFFAAPFERTFIYGAEPKEWTQGLGLLIALVGLWMVLAARIQLGFFSPRLADDGQSVLVTTGLYRFIRHPIYLGEFVVLFGWPFVFGAPVTLVLASVTGIFVLARRIRYEEAELIAQFGTAYADYQRVTDKCIPNLW